MTTAINIYVNSAAIQRHLHYPRTDEVLPREDRYLNMMMAQMTEVHDLDFGAERGTFFNTQRPLAVEERFGCGVDFQRWIARFKFREWCVARRRGR